MRIDQQVKLLKDEGPGVCYYKPENANKIILGHTPEWSLPKSRNNDLLSKNNQSKFTLPGIGKYDI